MKTGATSLKRNMRIIWWAFWVKLCVATAYSQQSFYHCGAEPTLNGSPATLHCDDFDDDNVWAVSSFNFPVGAPGVSNPANDGWGMGIYYPNAGGVSGDGTNGSGFNPPVIPGFAVAGQGVGGTTAATNGPYPPCNNGNDAMNGWHNYVTGPGNGGPGENEIFTRFYMKYAPGSTFGHEKVFGVDRTAGENYLLLEAYNMFASGELGIMTMQMQGDPPSIGGGGPLWNNIDQNNGSWAVANLAPKLIMVPGRWYYIEFRARMNTLGLADGIIEFWMDDCGADGLTNCKPGVNMPTKRASYTSVKMRSSVNQNPNALFGASWIEAFANSCATGQRYNDNVAVVTPAYCPGRTAGQPCIGFAGGTPNPPLPPAKPNGLSLK